MISIRLDVGDISHQTIYLGTFDDSYYNHLLYQYVNYNFTIICLQILFTCIMLSKLLMR
jgi:hypothetical protein